MSNILANGDFFTNEIVCEADSYRELIISPTKVKLRFNPVSFVKKDATGIEREYIRCYEQTLTIPEFHKLQTQKMNLLEDQLVGIRDTITLLFALIMNTPAISDNLSQTVFDNISKLTPEEEERLKQKEQQQVKKQEVNIKDSIKDIANFLDSKESRDEKDKVFKSLTKIDTEEDKKTDVDDLLKDVDNFVETDDIKKAYRSAVWASQNNEEVPLDPSNTQTEDNTEGEE